VDGQYGGHRSLGTNRYAKLLVCAGAAGRTTATAAAHIRMAVHQVFEAGWVHHQSRSLPHLQGAHHAVASRRCSSLRRTRATRIARPTLCRSFSCGSSRRSSPSFPIAEGRVDPTLPPLRLAHLAFIAGHQKFDERMASFGRCHRFEVREAIASVLDHAENRTSRLDCVSCSGPPQPLLL
jgi:hypothetical protein